MHHKRNHVDIDISLDDIETIGKESNQKRESVNEDFNYQGNKI